MFSRRRDDQEETPAMREGRRAARRLLLAIIALWCLVAAVSFLAVRQGHAATWANVLAGVETTAPHESPPIATPAREILAAVDAVVVSIRPPSGGHLVPERCRAYQRRLFTEAHTVTVTP